MQEEKLFEYAVIRVVPRVEREEFLNVGVILYCAGSKFLQAIFFLDEARLQSLFSKIAIEEIKDHLCAFEQICLGATESGPIGKLDIASRFRWLTAARSTVLQTSQVHPGFCVSASETLERLYTQLVL